MKLKTYHDPLINQKIIGTFANSIQCGCLLNISPLLGKNMSRKVIGQKLSYFEDFFIILPLEVGDQVCFVGAQVVIRSILKIFSYEIS